MLTLKRSKHIFKHVVTSLRVQSCRHMKNGDEDKWASAHGINISLASSNDIDELKEFMLLNYYPYEAITSSCGIAHGNGLSDKYARYVLNRNLLVNYILKNDAGIACSPIARSIADDTIVGCMIGAIYSKHDNLNDTVGAVGNWLGGFSSFFRVPRKIVFVYNLTTLNSDMHFSKQDAFSELQDSGDMMHFAQFGAVSTTQIRIGLAKELNKRAFEIAKDAGCRYTYFRVTSSYAQDYYNKLSNTKVLHEARYSEYKYDNKGRPFLLETEVHKVMQVMATDHGV